ncbi:hypothetical protein HYH02_000446 [Chlamydomonas schloesseri]|uniref:Uncharacterized protein n=1 Tax=Chlamydomonas schloesseri TaxID=2026947 RepID=A0A835WYF9_9CHLO|nr:hypothetical protein HYH02_000446 [Chlamydomonas schloesseri]|eukprot:KAG2454605.1 hypothetical protein HYH02_000446 [Chlamydomonas schloesseri]
MPLTATWTDQEDEALRKLVKEYGPKKWSVIAQKLKTKGSKQCRRRWKNYLNADLKSGGWTAEEDRILMEGHRLYGNKWTEIAKMVGGRTDNAVKNRYAALCKRDMRGGGSVRRAVANGGGGGGATRGGRKARPANSDSDNASDVELDDDSDAEEEAKRSSSFSSDRSREPSPSRGSKGSRGAAAEGSTRSPATRGSGGGAVSPRAAVGGSGGRAGSILGPRRRSAAAAITEESPPPQAEPDEAPAAKRRAVMNGGTGASAMHANGLANERHLPVPTPRTPRTPRLLAQLQEASLANNIHQHQHAAVAASRAGAGVGRGLVGSGGKVGAPPKKPPALTINIPNPSAADPMAQPPPTSSGAGYGIEIRVLRDLLTPQEIQYARELNDMQLPLHINVDDDPLMVVGTGLHPPGGVSAGGLPTTAGVLGCGGGTAASGLGTSGISHGEAPLTTSRQAAHNALNALVSPGSAGGALADFNDVLRWFQSGLTPKSTYGGSAGGLGTLGGTPRNMLGSLGRTGLTPRGLHTSTGRGGHDVDGGGLGLGTGLTPRGLRGGSGGSPASGSGSGTPPSAERLGPNAAVSAGTPSMRTRRQIAVAAAVAAAAGPGPSSTSHAAQQGTATQGAFAGAELHAGHRQLLTKLIQNAAVPSETPKPGAAAEGGNAILSARGDLRVMPPPSPGVFSPGAFLATSRGPATRSAAAQQQQQAVELQTAGSAGVVVMPQFTQQELLLLLEVLNSDDLQALPPPPEVVA